MEWDEQFKNNHRNKMGFIDLNLKHHYNSQNDNLLKDFYIPALSQAKEYYRASGFFNSSSLAAAAPGLKEFILNNGKMKLVCGSNLEPKDVKSIMTAEQTPEIISSKFLEDLDNIENKIIRNHVKILGWMIANNHLEIKITFKVDEFGKPLPSEKGIMHYKIGVMKDNENQLLSFSGSNNETYYGWNTNIEEFKVYKGWDGDGKFVKVDIELFKELWEGQNKNTLVMDIPSAVKEKLIEISPKKFTELDFTQHTNQKNTHTNPKIKLFSYQIDAIENWTKNNHKGVFAMATGTGKTYTALGCVEKEMKNNDKLLAIISCPYRHLIQQWQNSIESYGLNPSQLILAYGGSKWKAEVEDALMNLYNSNKPRKVIIITTHDTLSSDKFINTIKEDRPECHCFLIADEMHGLGSYKRRKGLLDEYDYRLGLSATPERYFDEVGTDYLFNYFSKTVYEFSLEDAINKINPATMQTYLTPYEYEPEFVSLTPSELEDYKKITKSIIYLLNKKNKSQNEQSRLENMFFRRANIVKNAHNKLAKLEEILDYMDDIKGLIIYCSPGVQINEVKRIVGEKRIVAHPFTMNEDATPKKYLGGKSEREIILDNFAKGEYEALIAIKCLDEGVDVTSASKAILMSSSNSPREFIQRIGRVIRRHENKPFAQIYDLIVKPAIDSFDPDMKEMEKSIFNKEMERYMEIAGTSLNRTETIQKIFNQKL